MKDINIIQQFYDASRPELIKSLLNQSIYKLVEDFITEMDAKNKAYYFILQSGQLENFKAYCEAHQTEK